MSVYTTVEQDELEAFLGQYDLGSLVNYKGISAGIENTNYFVTTSEGEFVLTLFEWLGKDELPYFLDLMAFLAEHEVPSAHPLADRDGHYLRELNGKPAALVYRLKGSDVKEPNIEQIRTLGKHLGHMHAVGSEFEGHRDSQRGPKWWKETYARLKDVISTEDAAIIEEELRFQALYRHSDLPRGVTHADLFRDNALWLGNELTGIIDFYYACNDVLLYDMAVTVNDWCSAADGSLDNEKVLAFLGTYHAERPLTANERGAWPVMLRAAALRFWLSRLQDLHFPRPGEITHTKNPDVFKHILVNRVKNHDNIQQTWI
jgi:homoserine kinase type II